MDSVNHKDSYSMVNLMVTEKDFSKYAQSINKALNGVEFPIKAKHLRFIVVGTFREQGAKGFWSVALRTPYLDDRIVSWKLCYIVHKILQDGHPLCIDHSEKHKKDLDQMGKLWVHLRGTYSQSIKIYTNLLITKINFHIKYPRFPGNLNVSDSELDSILSNDLNNYFQIAIEIFDYLDRIIELQSAIFSPINVTQNNTETISSADQCLLAPIDLCLEDASKLYDVTVKIMHKLQKSVPSDVITGHKSRFIKIFGELKEFYQRINSIIYLRNILTVQQLPENPPDFCNGDEYNANILEKQETQATGFRLADDVHLLNKSGELTVDYSNRSIGNQLVDLSFKEEGTNPFRTHSSPSAPLYDQIYFEGNDKKINSPDLQQEIEDLRIILSDVTTENQKKTLILENKISELENQLEEKNSQLLAEKQLRESLQNSTVPGVSVSQNAGFGFIDTNNVSNLYSKLREDYILLIRKNGELQKQIYILETKLSEKDNNNSLL